MARRCSPTFYSGMYPAQVRLSLTRLHGTWYVHSYLCARPNRAHAVLSSLELLLIHLTLRMPHTPGPVRSRKGGQAGPTCYGDCRPGRCAHSRDASQRVVGPCVYLARDPDQRRRISDARYRHSSVLSLSSGRDAVPASACTVRTRTPYAQYWELVRRHTPIGGRVGEKTRYVHLLYARGHGH